MEAEEMDWIAVFSNYDTLLTAMERLKKMPLIEAAHIVEELPNEVLVDVMPHFGEEQQGFVFAEFDKRRQLSFFQASSKRHFAGIFSHMPSDDRADFFQHLTQEEQVALLPYLSKQVRENVMGLSAYPPETAGGIMSTDFATVGELMTCTAAIAKVRIDAPSKRMIYYVYVVDEEQHLKGFITLKDLIMADPDTLVQEASHKEFVFAFVDEDRETVAQKVEKYDLVAMPILNHEEQLVGIVTHDDIIDIIRAEHTEDMEKFMGIVSGDSDLDYLDTSSWSHFKRRVVWLVSLAAVGIISGVIIHSFEDALQKLLILALYMPMVADTGGNSGSQAATVVIRALALGQITLGNWFRVIWKEIRISLLLAICLGVLAYGKVLFLSWETETPSDISLPFIAFMISLALSLQVVTATMVGAALPLIVKRLGGDPAVAASPAITTIVDITGLLIYFGMAMLFFSL